MLEEAATRRHNAAGVVGKFDAIAMSLVAGEILA
jgi:hypothetical protein